MLTIIHRIIGSPLRVQGKVTAFLRAKFLPRITPACAGKSNVFFDVQTTAWDHPCVCREKCLCGVIVDNTRGSPLRVQGKAFADFLITPEHRITPACAGKSTPFTAANGWN